MKSNIFEGDYGSFENFQICFSSWLLKSNTDFYESENLVLPWWFGVLCFSYTVRAVVDFFIAPKWHKHDRLPLPEMFLVLGCVQGLLSFTADFMNMTNNTVIHIFDRCLALPNFLVETAKILYAFNYVRRGTFWISILCLPCAAFCFLKSSDAQVAQDTDGFIFWHNMWHLIPLATVPVHIYEYIILGELDYSDSKEYVESRPPLLSSIIMSKTADDSIPGKGFRAKKSRRRTRKE